MVEIGLIIWVCEGTKKGNRRMVELVNSNPKVIVAFLGYLRSLGIDEKKIRARVKIHSNQERDYEEEYWSKITKIPRSQFTRPIQRKYPSDGEHGCLTIRYHSVKLYNLFKKKARQANLL